MKRASILVVTLVMALSMAVALCGCTSNNYTPQAKEQTVSDSALKSSGTLRVGVNASNAPYALAALLASMSISRLPLPTNWALNLNWWMLAPR